MAYDPKTAKEVLAASGGGSTVIEDEAKAKADAANVSSIEYRNYAAAMDNYQKRDDVETLARRRARENGVTFTTTDYVRSETYDPNANTPAPGA